MCYNRLSNVKSLLIDNIIVFNNSVAALGAVWLNNWLVLSQVPPIKHAFDFRKLESTSWIITWLWSLQDSNNRAAQKVHMLNITNDSFQKRSKKYLLIPPPHCRSHPNGTSQPLGYILVRIPFLRNERIPKLWFKHIFGVRP